MSEPFPLFIGGRAHAGVSVIERENPSRPAEIVGSVAAGDAALTTLAIDAAQLAFPAWAELGVEVRTGLVREAISRASATNPDRAEMLARELGKVAVDALGELGFAAAFAAYAAPVAERLSADVVVEDAEGRLVTVQEPFGVIAAITPWNAPVILAALKVVPALMTGNTMVLKPSPLAPLAVTQFLSEVASQLPDGVLNIVNGGMEVGETLVADPRIAKITFTGGLATARSIAATAARRVTPTVMELGGNDAAIFLPDAEYTEAMYTRAVFGAFLTSGQVCMAIKRIFVPVDRHDEFVAGFLAAAEKVLHVRNPLDPTSTMGPVVSREHQSRLNDLIRSAEAAGGTLHEVGSWEVADEDADGYWVRPTLVTGLTDEHPLVSDEQFGPVVPVLTYQSEDEVVRRANSVEQSLASSVWSTDDEHAAAVARRLDVGFTFLNCANRAGTSLRAAFGGRGLSGHGREFGPLGLGEYLQSHSINYPNAVRQGTALGNAYPVPA
ncbi:aldehyde dehydrogenase [Subtercola sp. Z020]|uniref:aldehyde dehydrogenase family protein n=1 Tax=Subtercola sp. Z020 TaxID=2080582 RepID=UPI00130EF7FA|nr:aldehyde dehydrogenase family protein [Subtercola sp. Z020]